MKTGQFIKPLQRLYKRRVDSSVLLFLAAVAAVIIANIPSVSGLYNQLLQYPIMVQIGEFNIFSHAGETMTLLDFTNDVLMVLFFLQVGLEIKQEGLVGELSTLRRAVFPVVGAIGGMIMPVLFFLLVCHEAPASNGMAIPMATDIAFALAVLSLLGKRVPSSLKAFLASLAVADDIGGILVIAIFYSTHLNLMMLLWAALCLGAIYLLGRLGVRSLLVYYIGAFVVWTFFLKSGVHTTIAGVLVAFLVPARPKLSTDNMADRMRTMLRLLPESEHKTRGKNVLLPHQQIAVVHSMAQDVRGAVSPVQRMEQQITPIVHFIVLPLFAFGDCFGATLGQTFGDLPFLYRLCQTIQGRSSSGDDYHKSIGTLMLRRDWLYGSSICFLSVVCTTRGCTLPQRCQDRYIHGEYPLGYPGVLLPKGCTQARTSRIGIYFVEKRTKLSTKSTILILSR